MSNTDKQINKMDKIFSKPEEEKAAIFQMV